MGGFLGIGTSPQEKALAEQKKLAQEEAERGRRDAEIALAEKAAKKGQETANINLGKDKTIEDSVDIQKKTLDTKSVPDQSLGLGGFNKGKKSGVQI